MERRAISYRTVFWGLALSLLGACLGAAYIYERYVRYEPLAARHLPSDVLSVTHVNVEQAVVYEPFRKHLLSLLELGRVAPEPRVKHLERKTTLELGVDSRELVFAELPEEQWLLLLAGMFRRDGVIEGVATMLRDEGVASRKVRDCLLVGQRAAFTIAADGTLVLASSLRVAEQARRVRAVEGTYRARLPQPRGALIVLDRNGGDEARASAWLEVAIGRPFPYRRRQSDNPAPGPRAQFLRLSRLLAPGGLVLENIETHLPPADPNGSGTFSQAQFELMMARLRAVMLERIAPQDS